MKRKKMKQRFKDWLICKLGGNPPVHTTEPFMIFREQQEVIRVQVERAIPKFQIETMSPEEEVDTVNRCLANLLGRHLIDRGYVTVSVKEESDDKVFCVSLKILKAVQYE